MVAWRKFWCADSAYYNYLGKFIYNSKLIRTLSYPSDKHYCLSQRYVMLNYTDGLIWQNAIREKVCKGMKIERVSKERGYIRQIEYIHSTNPLMFYFILTLILFTLQKGTQLQIVGGLFITILLHVYNIYCFSLIMFLLLLFHILNARNLQQTQEKCRYELWWWCWWMEGFFLQ